MAVKGRQALRMLAPMLPSSGTYFNNKKIPLFQNTRNECQTLASIKNT